MREMSRPDVQHPVSLYWLEASSWRTLCITPWSFGSWPGMILSKGKGDPGHVPLDLSLIQTGLSGSQSDSSWPCLEEGVCGAV